MSRVRVRQAVRCALQRIEARQPVVVGFSGGVDSTVLLEALAQCRGPENIVAWHVHHGLQPAADDWQRHCGNVAQALGVRFGTTRLGVRPSGSNVEAWARAGRYRALWAAVRQSGAAALLVAHHADDQVETVLMRLARGSGPAALAGMPAARREADGWLLRPLLALGREEIVACARERGLRWVDDPMNADPDLLRSALRGRIVPELARLVPEFRANVLRSARWLREAGEAVQALAARDLRDAGIAPGAGAIDRRGLAALPAAQRAAAARAWIGSLGAPVPGHAALAQWMATLLAGDSAHARFEYAGWRFVRYRDRVEVLEPLGERCAEGWNEPARGRTDERGARDPARGRADAPEWRDPASRRTDGRQWRDPARSAPAGFAFRWRGEPAIAVPGWGGSLIFEPGASPHDPGADWLRAQPLSVHQARAGSRLRPRAGGPSRTLKNLFQERAIAPHLRPSWPALFAGDALLFAAGFGPDRTPGRGAGDARRVRVGWRFDDERDPRAQLACRRAPDGGTLV